MRREDPALTEFVEPGMEILHRVHYALEQHVLARHESEQAAAYDLMDRAIGPTIFVERLPHDAHRAPTPALSQADSAMCCRGAHVHQDAVRTEDPMCFEEGMNHALSGHSSESPGEHRAVELACAIGQPLGGAHSEANMAGMASRESRTGPANLSGVRIQGRNARRAEAGEAQRETPASATHFEHAFSAPSRETAERFDLAPHWIDDDRHGRHDTVVAAGC